MKVIKCEAIKRDGSVWATYTLPVEGHEAAVENVEAEMHRFQDTVREAAQEEGVELASPPLLFTPQEMEPEEYDSIVIHDTFRPCEVCGKQGAGRTLDGVWLCEDHAPTESDYTDTRRVTLRELDALSCEWCGGERPKKNSRFCSKECYYNATWKTVSCRHCGSRFDARRIYLARGQMKFCSTRCSGMAARRHEVVERDGVRYYTGIEGYLSSDQGKLLHHVVWEEENGIPVPGGHVVHHIDGNKSNNDIGNLALMKWGEHSAHHNRDLGQGYGEFTCRGCGALVRRLVREISRGQNKFCSRSCSNLHRLRRKDGSYAPGHA